jgi:serine/threonine-protein kinase
VKVLDFGIAKAFDAEGRPTSNLTTTGMALGTPSYMAPEQVRDAKLVDRRTDIWGLGSVLFQLLTGRPPFEADNVPALCAKIVADPAPTLVSLRPEVPPRLSEIVARCLEKDMQRRHQSVAALAQALAEVAPETSQERIARILRVAELRNSLSPGQSGDWSLRDSFTDTVVSSSGASAAGEVTITGSVAATAKPSSARDGSVNDTGGAWQTDPRPPHRRTALALATAVVIGGGLLWWAAPWSGDPDAPVVAPPEPAAAREPPADRREQAARETEAAPPPASASADASPVRPPRAAAPIGQVEPPTTTPPEPPPAASASAGVEPRKDPLLDDRK